MKLRVETLTVILLLVTTIVLGQAGSPPAPQLSSKPPALLPPSPDAFQFTRYGNLPIGLSTGAAQFSLPIYTVRSGALSHAVSIGYSTNGVKVDEQAGRTGLGWSLRAGGVITRTVMDKPDGGAGIQPTYYHGNLSTTPGNRSLYDYASQASNNTPPDFQPDEYSFSMDGLSGKFTQRENGSFAQFNASGVRIAKNTNGFLLTAPNGVQYQFYLTESARNYSYPLGSTMQWVPSPEPTAWYLTKVLAPNGDSIVFHYQYVNPNGTHLVTYQNGISQEYVSTTMSTDGLNSNTGYLRIRYDGANVHMTPGCSGSGGLNTTVQLSDNVPYCLSAISFNGGNVQFRYSGREDAPGEKKLDSVSVYRSSDGYRVACTVLGYTYANAAAGQYDAYLANSNYSNDNPHLRKRLFLTTAQELGANNELGLQHTFEYNDMNSLPSRLSFAQDRYGAFNGKANGQYFFPNDTWFDWHIGNTRFGADRTYSFVHAQKGALKKITYPTGGYTEISYAPNKIAGDYAYTIQSDSVFALLDTSTTAGQEVLSATIQHNGGNLLLRANCNWASVPLSVVDANGGATGFDDAYYISWYLMDANADTCVRGCAKRLSPGESAINGHFGFELASGTYRIKIVASKPGLKARISLEKWQRVANNNLQSGIAGIRVAAITDYDNANSQAGYKKYIYGDWGNAASNSGTGLQNDNGYNGSEIGFTENMAGSTTCGQNSISSSSVTTNFLTDNGTVFYTKVIEVATDAAGIKNNGGTEYEFYYQPKKKALPLLFDWYVGNWAETQPLPTTPGAPLMNNDFLTGMPKATRTFMYNTLHGDRTVLTETINHYSIDTPTLVIDTFLVSKLARPVPDDGGISVTSIPVDLQTYLYRYDLYRYWRYYGFAKLDSTVAIDYSGAVPAISKTVYSNHSLKNYQPRVISYTAANGNSRSIVRKYAGDVQSTENGYGAVYLPMVNANIVDALVAETIMENSNEMAKTSMAYNAWPSPNSGSQYLPSLISTSQNGMPPDTELTYQQYDVNGNILQYTDRAGTTTAIIWGYGGSYPVARITGITYANAVAQSGIDMGVVNNPANEAQIVAELAKLRQLPGITDAVTRTYKPMVGIGSETAIRGRTVYYEYDPFNRLKAVKDAEGNAVKKVDYFVKTNPGL